MERYNIGMSSNPSDPILQKIFAATDTSSLKVRSRESSTVEFKENFNWASKDKYAKAMAAFANSRGGHLIFGITNSPRRLVGLSGSAFDQLDEATITGYLNSIFSPAISYEKFTETTNEKIIGVIRIYPHDDATSRRN